MAAMVTSSMVMMIVMKVHGDDADGDNGDDDDDADGEPSPAATHSRSPSLSTLPLIRVSTLPSTLLPLLLLSPPLI